LQALSGTPYSYVFADLQLGVYTVTLYDNNAVWVKLNSKNCYHYYYLQNYEYYS